VAGWAGTIEVHSTSLLVLTMTTLLSGSNAAPPHSLPPLNCGSTAFFPSEGGVKSGAG